MTVEVDENACIGCGACVGVAPNVFELNDDGISVVKVDEVSESDKESAQSAIDTCPVSAISEVE